MNGGHPARCNRTARHKNTKSRVTRLRKKKMGKTKITGLWKGENNHENLSVGDKSLSHSIK